MPSNKKHKPDYSKAPIESQRRMGRYIPPQQELEQPQQEPKHHYINRWGQHLEQSFWEPLLEWGKKQAWIELLGLLSNVSLLIAALAYIGLEKQRREAQIYLAWQTITNAQGQSGNGGRVIALEFLNASPGANWRLHFPWICFPNEWVCSKWEAEDLAGIDVSKAYLGEVQLPKADLWNANLQEAELSKANLQEAELIGANLQEADLLEANLKEARLLGVNLQGAYLLGVNLQEARLFRANMKESNLIGANLQGADLRSANLQGADLGIANLQGVDLRSANLQGADLVNANLQGAIYTNEQTSKEKCEEAFLDYSCPTLFPEGFDPKAAGMILFQDLPEEAPK